MLKYSYGVYTITLQLAMSIPTVSDHMRLKCDINDERQSKCEHSSSCTTITTPNIKHKKL